MNISIGIVGLPNVGKSTLFNALTKRSVPAENYPFCTIEPSVGIIPVPDDRLRLLSEFSKTKKTVPAVIEFVDIAGLVEGASKGEGLGNAFLTNIRECNAILHLVRIFELTDKSGTIINHVYGNVDPLHDIGIIEMELILSDLKTVENRIAKITRDAKRGDKDAVMELEILEALQAGLAAETPARIIELPSHKETDSIVHSYQLLTMKPVLYGLNFSSNAKNIKETEPEKYQQLLNIIKERKCNYVELNALLEADLKEMDPDEKKEFKQELGEKDDGLEVLIREAYDLLNLMTYFTTGVEETRAWTTPKNSTAPVAARAIHTDFQTKFIRAQVIEWDTLLKFKSFAEAKENGKLRIEGKEYIVKDGDVMEFMI